MTSPEIRKTGTTAAPVHRLPANRWSARGFDPAHAIDHDTLTLLLEAAR